MLGSALNCFCLRCGCRLLLPRLQTGPTGTQLLDGPDVAVEGWDALRPSVPEPVLLPRPQQAPQQYHDLLAMHRVGGWLAG